MAHPTISEKAKATLRVAMVMPWIALYAVLGIAAFGFYFFALGVLGWQCFSWLQTGEWPGHSALVIARLLDTPGVLWAAGPTTWLGVHRFLDWLPLSAAYAMVGAAFHLGYRALRPI